MAEDLTKWYGIDIIDARALAWTGLKETSTWKDVTPESKATYFGLADRYKNRNDAYDTIIYNGSLKERDRDCIINNIYSTQGHWKMPRGTKRTRTYWFVYSYFNFGPYAYINPNCGEFTIPLHCTATCLLRQFAAVGGQVLSVVLGPEPVVR